MGAAVPAMANVAATAMELSFMQDLRIVYLKQPGAVGGPCRFLAACASRHDLARARTVPAASISEVTVPIDQQTDNRVLFCKHARRKTIFERFAAGAGFALRD
jgi:hypothetical protein